MIEYKSSAVKCHPGFCLVIYFVCMYSKSMMDELMLFTDGSVDTLSKNGYGAYLIVADRDRSLAALRADVTVKRFEQTSSTKLELQIMLWALNDIREFEGRVVVYTDSQNIVGLTGRRRRLEENDYCSKKNRRLNNYELYQEFFRITDELNCEFIKISGHKVSHRKDTLDTIFTLVDRASRKALREDKSCCAKD